MFKRNMRDRILEALTDTPAVFLNGARQTGKSTLVESLRREAGIDAYLTLDDMGVLAAATADPEGFLAGLPARVALDEVQRAPGLFPAIKASIDRDRRPGRFLLTGSADVLLLPRVAGFLAGRMEVLTLWPLSQGELRGVRDDFVAAMFAPESPSVGSAAAPTGAGTGVEDPRSDIIVAIVGGGYPEAVARAAARRRTAWFDSYVTTVLQRDVRDLAEITGLTDLPRLLRLLAARSGTLLNQAEISRSAGLPYTTLRRYTALLEAAFLMGHLSPYTANLGKRSVKSPKVIIHDSGLATSLLDLDEERLRKDPLLLGHLLETFVVGELRRQLGWSEVQANLHHFRTQSGVEVDVVLETPDGRVGGVEVKAAGSVGAADFRGLRGLAEAAGPRFVRGVVLYLGATAIPFGERLFALPVAALWGEAKTGRGDGL